MPGPAKVPREKVAFLIALHQVMMGRLDGQQLGMLASGIRAVYGKAAALGTSPTESLLREELRAQAEESRRADAPEIAATLRNLADQLSASTAARAPTPTCSTGRRPFPSRAHW